MNLPELLSAPGWATGELEDPSMIVGDYSSKGLWSMSRITLDEKRFCACLLEVGDEVMGIVREDFVGVFRPQQGKRFLAMPSGLVRPQLARSQEGAS